MTDIGDVASYEGVAVEVTQVFDDGALLVRTMDDAERELIVAPADLED